MPRSNELTVHDPRFANAVSQHVKQVEAAIAKIEDPVVVSDLAKKGSALEQYARQIKTSIPVLNELKYAHLLCCGRLGRLLPRQKRGRGNKSENTAALQEFNPHTLATYRKIGDHFDKITPFYHELKRKHADDPESEERLSAAKFLSEVGASVKKSRNRSYSGNSEWYTPEAYVEAARSAMGAIDLDPASCAKAQKTIRAATFFSAKDNGLSHEWHGNVWMNPPYNRGLISDFVNKFCEELDAGRIKQGIVLTNNTTDTAWWHELARRCRRICFTLGRIKFSGSQNSNVNGQTFFYFGKRRKAFENSFAEFGLVFPFEGMAANT